MPAPKAYTTVSKSIKNEFKYYAAIHEAKVNLVKLGKKYLKYKSVRTTVEEDIEGKLLAKLKDIVTGIRIAGGVVSRRMVIVTGIRIVKANCPSRLKSYRIHLGKTEVWARNCGNVV